MRLPFRNSTLREKTPFFMGLLLGLICVPITLTGWGLDYFPGDLGDSRFNLYILEHGYKFLSGQIGDYWNAPFMFPEPNVISYSDNLLGTVPLYGLFRLLGFESFTAFQLWFISLFALNYTCFYFFAKYLFKNRYAATIGAFVFTFSLAVQPSMAHVQILPRFFMPLAFWMILRFGEDFKPRYFFLALLFMTGELYASIYLGLLTFLSGGLFLALVTFTNWKKLIPQFRLPRWWIRITAVILTNAALIYVLMHPYLERSNIQVKAPYPEILQSVPTPLSYIYSKPGSLVWDFLSRVGNTLPIHWNQQLFPGGIAFISVLVLLGFFVFRIRKLSKPILLLFSTGLVILLVFMRFGDFTLYKLIYVLLPGYDSMRSMDRIINIDLLFFGIAAGWLFAFIFRKKTQWQFPAALIFIGLLCLDNYVEPESTIRTEKSIGWSRVHALVGKMQDIPKNSVISYEPDSVGNAVAVQLDAMLASQYSDLKCINAYTATCPRAFGSFWREINADARINWLESVNADRTKVYIVK